jgi:hypothetical protein
MQINEVHEQALGRRINQGERAVKDMSNEHRAMSSE